MPLPAAVPPVVVPVYATPTPGAASDGVASVNATVTSPVPAVGRWVAGSSGSVMKIGTRNWFALTWTIERDSSSVMIQPLAALFRVLANWMPLSALLSASANSGALSVTEAGSRARPVPLWFGIVTSTVVADDWSTGGTAFGLTDSVAEPTAGWAPVRRNDQAPARYVILTVPAGAKRPVSQ